MALSELSSNGWFRTTPRSPEPKPGNAARLAHRASGLPVEHLLSIGGRSDASAIARWLTSPNVAAHQTESDSEHAPRRSLGQSAACSVRNLQSTTLNLAFSVLRCIRNVYLGDRCKPQRDVDRRHLPHLACLPPHQ